MKYNFKSIIEEIRVFAILIVIAFTVKTTLVEIYVVPTGSMENTILTGDMLIGNKFIYGMRTPTWVGLPWSRIGFDIPWKRLPEFKKVENGDVTIFEFPRDPFQKYVKRCIGIPGDKISIKGGIVYINDDEMVFPEDGKYVKGYIYDSEKKEYIYPYFTGNRDNISEFIVPYKGMEIEFKNISDWETIITLLVQDGNNVKIGNSTFTMIDPTQIARVNGFLKNKILRLITSDKKALMREERDRIDFINKFNYKYEKKGLINPWYVNYKSPDINYLLRNITINGKSLLELQSYKLKRDYYFLMGDNRDSSYDSRFWGFVPDNQILGTPIFALVNLFKFKLRLKPVS